MKEKHEAMAAALAYLMCRELYLLELSVNGYRHSSAPGLEEVIVKKEQEIERVRGIVEDLSAVDLEKTTEGEISMARVVRDMETIKEAIAVLLDDVLNRLSDNLLIAQGTDRLNEAMAKVNNVDDIVGRLRRVAQSQGKGDRT